MGMKQCFGLGKFGNLVCLPYNNCTGDGPSHPCFLLSSVKGVDLKRLSPFLKALEKTPEWISSNFLTFLTLASA